MTLRNIALGPGATSLATAAAQTNGTHRTRLTDGSVNVAVIGDALKVATASEASVEVTKAVAYFYTGGGDIDYIETTYGARKRVDTFSYSGADLIGVSTAWTDT